MVKMGSGQRIEPIEKWLYARFARVSEEQELDASRQRLLQRRTGGEIPIQRERGIESSSIISLVGWRRKIPAADMNGNEQFMRFNISKRHVDVADRVSRLQ